MLFDVYLFMGYLIWMPGSSLSILEEIQRRAPRTPCANFSAESDTNWLQFVTRHLSDATPKRIIGAPWSISNILLLISVFD